MTIEEFSNEFDTLLSSYTALHKFGEPNPPTLEFDEYEKSVFLTKAQEEVVVSLYSGKNPFGDSFEKTEEVRRYLNDLVKTWTTTAVNPSHTGLSKTSVFVILPEDLWFITYESAQLHDDNLGCMNDNEVLIVPVSQDEYYRTANNPFRGPNKKRVLRLDYGKGEIELISDYHINRYLVRYVSRPEPIILTDLPEGLSINKVSKRTECKLNPVVHRAILERAVKMAIISKVPLQANNK